MSKDWCCKFLFPSSTQHLQSFKIDLIAECFYSVRSQSYLFFLSVSLQGSSLSLCTHVSYWWISVELVIIGISQWLNWYVTILIINAPCVIIFLRVREKNKKLHYHFIDFMHCCVFPVCLRYWGSYQCTIWCSWWHCCSQGHQEKTGDNINLWKGLEPSCISLYFSVFLWILTSFALIFNPVFLSDLIKA